mmetsp:Transcript_4407/g.7395  ORF Transcript_4407/g.7395 Transcript_4407/m.7395 type:complete len:155 (-) Transcript_4407:130-594(-)
MLASLLFWGSLFLAAWPAVANDDVQGQNLVMRREAGRSRESIKKHSVSLDDESLLEPEEDVLMSRHSWEPAGTFTNCSDLGIPGVELTPWSERCIENPGNYKAVCRCQRLSGPRMHSWEQTCCQHVPSPGNPTSVNCNPQCVSGAPSPPVPMPE